jgi:hypothetical protein
MAFNIKIKLKTSFLWMRIFITGQNKENPNQIFSRYTKGK